MTTPLTADELLEKYSDPDVKTRLFDLLDLRQILALCLIRKDYRVTQKLYEPVEPSPAGLKLIEAVKRKGVPYPEARMYCLLEMLHVNLLLDLDATDIERLVHAIGNQIKEGLIRFPFTHGRLLYDRALELELREDKITLSEAETNELLDGTPQGVFQLGRYITGPYGLLESSVHRYAPPMLKVAFHCSDTSCRAVHYRYLTTSEDAEVNEHRTKVIKQLDRDRTEPSEWGDFFRRCAQPQDSEFNDLAGDPVVYLLGDALDLNELRCLFEWLLDNSDGELRTQARVHGISGRADSVAKKLSQAELLQLILTLNNRLIFNGLDILVSRGVIDVPKGEIRRSVLSGQNGFGWYRLYAELSENGIRLQSAETDVAPLRLRRLVGQMYRLDVPEERSELTWQLRGQTGDSLEASLEQYLQNHDPRAAVSSLLLARRSNMVVALEELDLHEKILDTDQDRINAVLWKLGFSVEDALDHHRDFWSLHQRMIQLTRQSPLGPLAVEQEQIRGLAASYFVKLEDVIRDSLLYTTWALTNDHPSSSKPFVYRPTIHEGQALQTLQDQADESAPDAQHRLNFGENLTLYPLIRGFQVLADYLESCQARAEEYARPNRLIPLWQSVQDIQQFPFHHTIPFLDLLDDSRQHVIRHLKDISRRLTGAGVSEARNEWLHARRSTLGVERLRESLDAVRDAIVLMQDAGFSRQAFRRIRTEIDEASRQTVVLADARGQEIVLFRPSRLQWLGLPSLDQTQHLMTCARFGEPTEVLRFRSQADSPYSKLWDKFPVRARTNTRTSPRVQVATSAL